MQESGAPAAAAQEDMGRRADDGGSSLPSTALTAPQTAHSGDLAKAPRFAVKRCRYESLGADLFADGQSPRSFTAQPPGGGGAGRDDSSNVGGAGREGLSNADSATGREMPNNARKEPFQGTRAPGRIERRESVCGAGPRPDSLEEARCLENVRANSKECICSFLSAELQQLYEVACQQRHDLTAQARKTQLQLEEMQESLRRASLREEQYWARASDAMRADARFSTFFSLYPAAACPDLGKYISNLEEEGQGGSGRNYYKEQFEKYKAENDELIDNSNELMETIQMLSEELTEEKTLVKAKEISNSAENVQESQEAARQIHQLQARVSALENELEKTQEEARDAERFKTKYETLKSSVERNQPFYDKIQSFSSAAAIRSSVKTPESMIHDISEYVQRLLDDNQRLEVQLTELEALNVKLAASKKGHNIGVNTSDDFLDEIQRDARRNAVHCCLGALKTVSLFSQAQLGFREMSRKEDEQFLLLDARFLRLKEIFDAMSSTPE